MRLKDFNSDKYKFFGSLITCLLCRYGLRGRELINNVGKVMLQGGGTFGTFMAIGTGIRC